MPCDLRDKTRLTHQDTIGLNFIRDTSKFVFRRHYRTGLRSHIMEVLDAGEVERESRGVVVEGLRWFPRARPKKMLRIFRTKFGGIEGALEEVAKVKIIEGFLGAHHVARSEEFLVDYELGGRYHLLLCGLQEYVEGKVLDPWIPCHEQQLTQMFQQMNQGKGERWGSFSQRIDATRAQGKDFINRVKRMVTEAGYIPDLAGVGNLILTPAGGIKLVDINNVSPVNFDSRVLVDDRGYPVCDKSIEALFLLEKNLLKRSPEQDSPVYAPFFDPLRRARLRQMERSFHESLR